MLCDIKDGYMLLVLWKKFKSSWKATQMILGELIKRNGAIRQCVVIYQYWKFWTRLVMMFRVEYRTWRWYWVHGLTYSFDVCHYLVCLTKQRTFSSFLFSNYIWMFGFVYGLLLAVWSSFVGETLKSFTCATFLFISNIFYKFYIDFPIACDYNDDGQTCSKNMFFHWNKFLNNISSNGVDLHLSLCFTLLIHNIPIWIFVHFWSFSPYYWTWCYINWL
jgi:hypothetical protein